MENIKFINSVNLFANLRKYSNKKICAMVKSNAYGHGLVEMVSLLENHVDYFGVVNVDEAVAVRKRTGKPVLVCSKVQDFKKCKKYQLDVMVDDENDLRVCHQLGIEGVHLKINSGMNRFGVKGFMNTKLINDFIEENHIALRSISTHFSDTANRRKTIKQYQKFLELQSEISQNVPFCFGGSGVMNYPFKFDIIRVGIGMYGYGDKSALPVMSINSYVEKVFYAKKGEFIGYGKKYRVKHEGFFAVVPVGYGDGLRRNLSGKFYVRINGFEYESVGNICMDAFFIKIDPSVKEGDVVEVLWDAEELAQKSKTISYEILTGFSEFRGKTQIIY
ncbi:MAG: alanine racemase [Candidatus Caccovivens sp.]